MDESKAVELLADAYRCEAVDTEEAYEFTPRLRNTNLSLSVSKSGLSATVAELDGESRHSSLWLHDDNSMEILVREESSMSVHSFRGGDLTIRAERVAHDIDTGRINAEVFLLALVYVAVVNAHGKRTAYVTLA